MALSLIIRTGFPGFGEVINDSILGRASDAGRAENGIAFDQSSKD